MCSLFDLCWDRGWKLFHEDRFEEAIAEWRVAADLDPEDGYVNTNIGLALSKLGRQEEAFSEWWEAIHLEPAYRVPYIYLADALLEAGYISKALATIRTAIRLCPASADLYIRLGHCLVNQANNKDKAGWQEAAKAFQQVMDIEPANSYARRYLAKAQWARGKKREAIATLESAISVNPEDFQAHKQLGGYQVGLGELRAAIRTIYAIYALPETEETDQYVANIERQAKYVIVSFYIGAGLAAVLVGVWIWNRRRG